VLTADALHCQKPHARKIAEKGGEYLLQIKANQPTLLAHAQAFDALPATPFLPRPVSAHGRIEVRHLHVFALEAAAVDFPFARSLIVVRSETTAKKTGRTSLETRYFVSSAEPDQRSPALWQPLVRGHWGGVEIRNYWRREIASIWGEDRSRTRNPNALANLALLHNALLTLLPEHYPDVPLPEVKERLFSDPAGCLRVLRSK